MGGEIGREDGAWPVLVCLFVLVCLMLVVLKRSVPEIQPNSYPLIHHVFHQKRDMTSMRWMACAKLPSCSEEQETATGRSTLMTEWCKVETMHDEGDHAIGGMCSG